MKSLIMIFISLILNAGNITTNNDLNCQSKEVRTELFKILKYETNSVPISLKNITKNDSDTMKLCESDIYIKNNKKTLSYLNKKHKTDNLNNNFKIDFYIQKLDNDNKYRIEFIHQVK
jgi:hypothetical protein